MLKALLAFFLFSNLALATTLTGTLKNPDGTGVNGRLYLSLSQQGALSPSGGCGGPIEIVPTYQAVIIVTNGALSGATTIYGNDCMLPADLYYNVTAKDNNGNTLFTDHWIIAGSTLDIGTIVSAVVNGTITTLGTPGYVMTNPAISQQVTQPSGTTLNMNNVTINTIITFPDGSTCTASGCSFAGGGGSFVTLNTVQTITAAKTFTTAIFPAAIGSNTTPTANGYFSGLIDVPTIAIYNGSLPSPTSSFTFEVPFTNVLAILDDTSHIIATWDVTTSSVNEPLMTVEGYTATEYGLINAKLSGVNLSCPSTAYNGLQAIRTDLGTPELQVCLNGTMYILGTGGSGTIAVTPNMLKGDNGGNAVSATAADMNSEFLCSDSSGSGTVQHCTTSPFWNLTTYAMIQYITTTTNTGDVTLAVNGATPAHIRKNMGASVLAAGDLVQNVLTPLYYDGTYWEILTTGNSASGVCSSSTSGNEVCATPNGSSGTASLRALVTADLPAATRARSIGASFGVKGGSVLTTGQVVYVSAPFACTISAWTAMIDGGTITFDVWKIANGTAVPTVSNTITASALPAISTGTAKTSTTLTGWTTSVAANDLFGFDINAVSAATTGTIQLECDN